MTLASVLVLDPEVLLLDEPTAALDPKSASQMIDFLVGLRGGPKTVITSTHDLDIVEDIADQCFVFQTGRVVAAGTPTEILGQTRIAGTDQSRSRPSACSCQRRDPLAPAHAPSQTLSATGSSRWHQFGFQQGFSVFVPFFEGGEIEGFGPAGHGGADGHADCIRGGQSGHGSDEAHHHHVQHQLAA